MAWAAEVLRSRPSHPREADVAQAYLLLVSGQPRGGRGDWRLVDLPGLALVHPLPFGYTLTVSSDPDSLGYAGDAVGWHDTPLVHFRTEGGHGVFHPAVTGGGMGSPAGIAEAANFLLVPYARLLGAITLKADEGVVQRFGFDSWDDMLERNVTDDLRLDLLSAAGLWPSPRTRESWRAVDQAVVHLDRTLRGISGDRLIWPVNAFKAFGYIPIPEVLAELGFRDESQGNDAAARAALTVAGGPARPPGPGRRAIDWHHWPELVGPLDEYELTVWSAGLHPDDQEFGDGIRYMVTLRTLEGGHELEIAEAQNEQALRMILVNLGLRP